MNKIKTIAEKMPAAGAQDFSAAAAVVATKDFRRLNWDELVSRGDFVASESQGFELWEGPSGFRADAFVKPIYRRQSPRALRAKPVR
jgi:hypothetical protein